MVPELRTESVVTALHTDMGLHEHRDEDIRGAEACRHWLELAQPAAGVDDGVGRSVVA